MPRCCSSTGNAGRPLVAALRPRDEQRSDDWTTKASLIHANHGGRFTVGDNGKENANPGPR